MKCPCQSGDAERLLDYCSGKVDPSTLPELELHVAACTECGPVVKAQRSVWDALESWAEVPVTADFNRRLFAAIAAEEAQHSALVKWMRSWVARWSPFSWRPALPVAAVCATLLAAFLIQTPAVQMQQATRDSQVKSEKVDVEQVEWALDDLEMLNKLSDGLSASAL